MACERLVVPVRIRKWVWLDKNAHAEQEVFEAGNRSVVRFSRFSRSLLYLNLLAELLMSATDAFTLGFEKG